MIKWKYEHENTKHKWENEINDKMIVQAFNINLLLLHSFYISPGYPEMKMEQKKNYT